MDTENTNRDELEKALKAQAEELGASHKIEMAAQMTRCHELEAKLKEVESAREVELRTALSAQQAELQRVFDERWRVREAEFSQEQDEMLATYEAMEAEVAKLRAQLSASAQAGAHPTREESAAGVKDDHSLSEQLERMTEKERAADSKVEELSLELQRVGELWRIDAEEIGRLRERLAAAEAELSKRRVKSTQGQEALLATQQQLYEQVKRM